MYEEGTFTWTSDNNTFGFVNWYPYEPSDTNNQDIGQTVPVVEFGRTSAKPPQFKKNVALNNDNFYLFFSYMNLQNVMMSTLQLT